jgi:hypothetical protein
MICRARWVHDRYDGQPNLTWPTGEKFIVALILGNQAYLHAADCTRQEAMQRLGDRLGDDAETWLADARAAL